PRRAPCGCSATATGPRTTCCAGSPTGAAPAPGARTPCRCAERSRRGRAPPSLRQPDAQPALPRIAHAGGRCPLARAVHRSRGRSAARVVELPGGLTEAVAGGVRGERRDVVAELEELTHWLDGGEADDDRAPACVRPGEFVDTVAEDASCQVESALPQTSGHTHAPRRHGALLQCLPPGAEGLAGTQGGGHVEPLEGRETLHGEQSTGATVIGDEVPAA